MKVLREECGLTYFQINNEHPRFYELLGWFFGSREVARELGMPIYDDPNREWIVVVADKYPIACSSIEFLKAKGKALMKSGWVHPNWRGKRIYNNMFDERIKIAHEAGVTKLGATVTDKSYNTHIRNGFREIGTKGRYKIMRKELD
ncbi:hypothetical protein COLU111180_12690 [Cohnella lubricantis]|uniref:N-acetyltransferase domain-containing protein n=1 Tax=Cohnella lubricantis TaxID=2163172 RepID=A0A841TEL9_9BACL|nr:hypothetical protein [Cohnella lubricantis]MBB6677427.1 hypothetical protein [Cohnella lubricantis]MBP2117525.1 N-acetylglutamate synthase-like GNAT family acetyltransferase [Cohnella lubricantis]